MKRIAILVTIISLFLFPGNTFCEGTAGDAAASQLGLEVFTICRDVVDRTPVASGSVYAVSVGKLYCFTKVVGAQTDTKIIHNWFLNGKLKASVTLPVKSASWRTWSAKEIKPQDAGDWMVEVLNEAGEPIESILFFIE
jgi:hypothetical protein